MLFYVLNEYVTNGYTSEYVLFTSLLSVVFAVLIIISKNPVISILFLICLFISVSVYLLLMGLTFMALSYLLVYVGAVSILFIFILMLISVRVSELNTEGNNSIPLAVIIVFSFNFAVSSISMYFTPNNDILSLNVMYFYKKVYNIFSMDLHNTFEVSSDKFQTVLANVTSKSWDSSLIDNNHITSIGNMMYTNLFILLIITSLILLVAMVGTIVITVTRK